MGTCCVMPLPAPTSPRSPCSASSEASQSPVAPPSKAQEAWKDDSSPTPEGPPAGLRRGVIVRCLSMKSLRALATVASEGTSLISEVVSEGSTDASTVNSCNTADLDFDGRIPGFCPGVKADALRRGTLSRVPCRASRCSTPGWSSVDSDTEILEYDDFNQTTILSSTPTSRLRPVSEVERVAAALTILTSPTSGHGHPRAAGYVVPSVVRVLTSLSSAEDLRQTSSARRVRASRSPAWDDAPLGPQPAV